MVVVVLVVLVLDVLPDGLLAPLGLLCPDGGVWVWLWPAVPAAPPEVEGELLEDGVEELGCVC